MTRNKRDRRRRKTDGREDRIAKGMSEVLVRGGSSETIKRSDSKPETRKGHGSRAEIMCGRFLRERVPEGLSESCTSRPFTMAGTGRSFPDRKSVTGKKKKGLLTHFR